MTIETDRKPSRWSFANVVFDERAWTLTVDGKPVAVEGKPLAVLRELLLHAGEKVTKEHLMEAVWPGVFVAEASLTTAMRKLREAIGDDRKDNRIIETVSGIGYRLIVSVECQSFPQTAERRKESDEPSLGAGLGRVRLGSSGSTNSLRLAAFGIACLVFVGASVFATRPADAPVKVAKSETIIRKEALTAIRRLDLDKIAELNMNGWDPNKSMSSDGNGALHLALEICEWDPAHDKQKLLLVVRMLFDAGAKIDQRNDWGDTPYSIANAERFCGPDHPATKFLHRECFSGSGPLGDRCIASYELERRRKREQLAPA